jgi:hypothetical protein
MLQESDPPEQELDKHTQEIIHLEIRLQIKIE